MAKRVTDEERIIEFFNSAETGKVETVYNIVKGIAKRRLAGPAVAGKKTPVKKTRVKVTVPAKTLTSVVSAASEF